MDELLREVDADPATLGLVLHGSRAGGSERAGSDYDLVRVATDERYEQGPFQEKRDDTDVVLQTPARLRRLAGEPGWWIGRPGVPARARGARRDAPGRPRLRPRMGRRPRAAEVREPVARLRPRRAAPARRARAAASACASGAT